jgi:NADPH:quinone reductase-like Zn-dependent oxidoreductase
MAPIPQGVPDKQQACIINSYGSTDVLQVISDHPTPKLTVNDDSLIIRVKAAGVNPVDYKIRKGALQNLMSLKFPAVLGIDFAGTIVALGSAIKGDFHIGDEVYGKFASPSNNGSYQQYIKVSTTKDLVVRRPPSLLFHEAGAVGVGALTAYVALVNHCGFPPEPPKDKDAAATPKQKVLVIGASGGVGMFGVQIAKKMGLHVTAIASGANAEFVKSLGADRFIDYKAAPLTEQLKEKDEFDGIFDCVGGEAYWELAQTILKPKKVFCTAAGNQKDDGTPVSYFDVGGMVAKMVGNSLFGSRKYAFVTSLPVNDYSPYLEKWMHEGSVRAYVKHSFPLSDIKKAHEQSQTGRTVGKIVVLP